MSWKDYPISCFSDGACSALTGVLAFYLGLVGGSIIFFAEKSGHLGTEWGLYAVAWIFLIPYTIAKLWGIALLPFLGVMLYGLVMKEWNRWVGASLIAIVFSSTVLFCSGFHSLECRETALPFILTMGSALLVLFLGSIWGRIWRRRSSPSSSV